MNQASKNNTDVRLEEIERKLSLLVDFVCGGRTPADLQAERLGSEFKKFRSQLGFGTEMLLQIESALTPHKNEAQFIEAGLPSVPDILADLSCSISNAFMPSDPGPEVIDGDIPSLPDMFSAILRQLGLEQHAGPAGNTASQAPQVGVLAFDQQEIEKRVAVYSLYRAKLARLGNRASIEYGLEAALLSATHGLNNELAGIAASLAPGFAGAVKAATGNDEPDSESIEDKLDMLAVAFVSLSEQMERHEKEIGTLANVLRQIGGSDVTKH